MDLTVREVISLMRQDAEVTRAMFFERISLFGSVDFTFMQFFFDRYAERLRLLEKVLEEGDNDAV